MPTPVKSTRIVTARRANVYFDWYDCKTRVHACSEGEPALNLHEFGWGCYTGGGVPCNAGPRGRGPLGREAGSRRAGWVGRQQAE
jgi:hypothetical protein